MHPLAANCSHLYEHEWLASSKKYHDATYNAKPIPPFEQPVTRTTVLRLDIVADQQERDRGVAVHVV